MTGDSGLTTGPAGAEVPRPSAGTTRNPYRPANGHPRLGMTSSDRLAAAEQRRRLARRRTIDEIEREGDLERGTEKLHVAASPRSTQDDAEQELRDGVLLVWRERLQRRDPTG